MTQAEAAGVPVGTYVYSLAKTNKEALAEAQLAIRQMQGHKVSYPVAFDLEDEKTLGTLTKKEVSQIALTFCDEIRKAGYTPMLYMNLNWYNNFVTGVFWKAPGLMYGSQATVTRYWLQAQAVINIRSGRALPVMKFPE